MIACRVSVTAVNALPGTGMMCDRAVRRTAAWYMHLTFFVLPAFFVHTGGLMALPEPTSKRIVRFVLT